MWGILSSTGRGEWKTCTDAFLFSMVNPYGLGPTKMPLKTQQQQRHAILCHPGYGPAFGGGQDLYISNNANANTSSYTFSYTYEHPPGQQDTFFTGSECFTVTDYEVFGLHTWQQSIQVTLHIRYLIHHGWYMKHWTRVVMYRGMLRGVLFIRCATWVEIRETLGTRL